MISISSLKNSSKRNYQSGLNAETSAWLYLSKLGYKILEHRKRTPFGELDIIAYKDKTLAFVEVKTSKKFSNAINAIKQKQIQRLISAADFFLSLNYDMKIDEHTKFSECDCRFDAIILENEKLHTHIENAWQAC